MTDSIEILDLPHVRHRDENTPKLIQVFAALLVLDKGSESEVAEAIKAYLHFNYPPETADTYWASVQQQRDPQSSLEGALQPLRGKWDARSTTFLAIKLCEMLRRTRLEFGGYLRRIAGALGLSNEEIAIVRAVVDPEGRFLERGTGGAPLSFHLSAIEGDRTFRIAHLPTTIDVTLYRGEFFVATRQAGALLNAKELAAGFAIRFGFVDELKSGGFRLLYRELQFLRRWYLLGQHNESQYIIHETVRPILDQVPGKPNRPVLKLRPTYLGLIDGDQEIKLGWHDSIAVGNTNVQVKKIIPLILSRTANERLGSNGAGGQGAQAILEVYKLSCRFGKRQGLTNISFSAAGGQMVAIMGPSGCGKSTLLGTLTGSIPLTGGSIKLDGQDLTNLVREDPRFLGFVPQDDVTFETLTVAENLHFGAQLRVTEAKSQRIKPLVDSVLDEIDLKERAAVMVGGPNKKTLSGGQRRRLNIGLEFLSPKPLLLLDEPTSGLSSADAERILQILRARADAGALVLVVIHQPSATLFRLFDRLLLLDKGGMMAFYGDPQDAGPYLAGVAPLPNSLDLKVADPEVLLSALEVPVRQFDGRSEDRREFEPQYWYARFERYRQQNPEPAVQSRDLQGNGRSRRSSLLQQFTLFRRAALSKVRDTSSLLALFGTACLLGLVVGVILRNDPTSDPYQLSSNQLFSSFPFLSAIVALFLGMSSSITEVLKERPIVRRERLLKVNLTVWLLSKFATLVVATALPIAAYTLLTFTLLGVPELHFLYFFYLWLTAAVGVAIGLAISSIPNISSAGATTFLPLVLVPQMILAGSTSFDFEKMQHMVVVGQKKSDGSTAKKVPELADIMPARWAYEGLIALHLNNSSYLAADRFIANVKDFNDASPPDTKKKKQTVLPLLATLKSEVQTLFANYKDSAGKLDNKQADIATLDGARAAVESELGKNNGEGASDDLTTKCNNASTSLNGLQGDVRKMFSPYKTDLSTMALFNPGGRADPNASGVLERFKALPFTGIWLRTEWVNGWILAGFAVLILALSRYLLGRAIR